MTALPSYYHISIPKLKSGEGPLQFRGLGSSPLDFNLTSHIRELTDPRRLCGRITLEQYGSESQHPVSVSTDHLLLTFCFRLSQLHPKAEPI